MKKSLLVSFLSLIAFVSTFAQTPGSLTVTATTSSAGGNFAPKNIVAIWIEDEQGNFVKTLLAYAQTRKTHLNTWEASTTAAGSPFNVVDALTGATKPNHGTRTCTWNGTDVSGNVVPDGTYKVWMELTDKNGTGNFSSFAFNKDTNDVNLTPSNVPSFASISITWDAVITSVDDIKLPGNYTISPNPTDGIIRVSGDHILATRVFSQSGALIFEGKTGYIDITGQPEGTYFVKVVTAEGTVTRKIIKK